VRRRQVIQVAVGVAGSAAFTLGLGAWRTRVPEAPNRLLPLPLTKMAGRLTDHLGQVVTPADWLGRPVILFFGFTFCPDVCPTTLINITGWLERLGSDAEEVAVALISVDPERDTPAVLAAFLANFDPRIIGYTGSASAISQTADAFRVHYEKVISGQGDYTVNHPAGVFLFFSDGRFGSIIDFHEDRRFAVPKIRRIIS
jgi:protein SCO1